MAAPVRQLATKRTRAPATSGGRASESVGTLGEHQSARRPAPEPSTASAAPAAGAAAAPAAPGPGGGGGGGEKAG